MGRRLGASGGGGRARSPSPELQNSPAASPRAPAVGRSSRHRPVSRGRPGSRALVPRGGGARGESRAARGGPLRSTRRREIPAIGVGAGEGPFPAENPLFLRQIARGPTSRLPPARPGSRIPRCFGLLPSPFAPRRAEKFRGRSQGDSPRPRQLYAQGSGIPGRPPSRRVRVPGALARVPLVGARGTCCAQAESVGPSWPLAAAAAPWRPQRRAADFGLGRWRKAGDAYVPLYCGWTGEEH